MQNSNMSKSEVDEYLFTKMMEQRARRAAKKVGLEVQKSRRSLSVDNHGGLQLIDPYFNSVEEGVRFELTPEDVIEICKEKELAANAA